jgi:hypothetical protein
MVMSVGRMRIANANVRHPCENSRPDYRLSGPWILPHGGTMTVDGTEHRVFADYA